MKEDIYSTRQRATDLLNETLSIWQKGDHIDQLEGLAKDPVFSLLMTALAYRANEMDGEVERLRQDVLEEFAKTPYADRLKATGVITSYICPLMYMNNPLSEKMPVITSSNKLRTYTSARFYTDDEILEQITQNRKGGKRK